MGKRLLIFLDILLSIATIMFLFPIRFDRLDLLLFAYAFLLFSILRHSEYFPMALLLSISLVLGRLQTTPLAVAVGIIFSLRNHGVKERLINAARVFWISGFLVVTHGIIFDKAVFAAAVFAFVPAVFETTFLIKSKKSLKIVALVNLAYLVLFTENLLHVVLSDAFLPIVLNPMVFFIYLLVQDYESIWQRYLLEKERTDLIRKKLAMVIDVVNTISQKATVEESLYKLAEAISVIGGFKYVLINVFDRSSGKILRLAHHGLNPEEFDRLKKFPPPIENFYRFAQERFKLSNSYFVPQGTVEFPVEYTLTLLNKNKVNHSNAQNWLPEDLLLVPIYNPEGEIVGYISVDAPFNGKRPSVEDVQILELLAEQVYKLLERSQSYQPLVFRASRDPHTFLLTHSAFLGLLEQHIKFGREFANVIIDIDDLSKINLKYGHEIGDKVIEKVADVLRTRTRKSDYVARFGGEEFAILIKDVSKSKAIEITHRILDEIRQIQLPEGIRITASAGIAVYPEHGNDYEKLIKEALKALQVAKKSGKDRLMVF
ncbi:sensor domain-containing diguanylate cyclase [Pseudothermotoga thermarum]|uniref:Diguanylate cyclase n=1 Tax=Pseudothermotoga thermarum DSM 5069 TaxID=688269 RepID=F7YX12_9THEM|nr:sensor domain-containing diguanylate cyclase [Pseudothermotoga thermarum]AEH50608.1 diguanylate cyclase [Pseudothermotoga thermarum DSM 5069]